MLVFSGLRGALGLAMGLFVEHNAYIEADAARSIAFYTSGIVFLTLVINGGFVDEVYKRLNLYRPSQYRIRHLTKQLQKVEMECQNRGLRRLQRHWFFKHCSLELIYPCVPNFSNVSFNQYSVKPTPTGIAPVHKVLSALEAHCYTLTRKARPGGAELPGSEAASTTTKVATWLNEAAKISRTVANGGVSDILQNVLDIDEGALEFRRLGDKVMQDLGLYASRRPLSEIVGRNNEASFFVRLSELGREHIVVGLTSTLPRPELSEEPSGYERIIGVEMFSAGLDCTTGQIMYNIGNGTEVLQDTWVATMVADVFRWCTPGSEVIGQKQPGEVFVGFKVGNWIRLLGEPGVVQLTQREAPPEGSAAEAAPPLDRNDENTAVPRLVRVPSDLGRVVTVAEPHAVEKPPRSFAVDNEVIVRVARIYGQPWHISFLVSKRRSLEPELIGTVSLGELSPGDLFPVVEFVPTLAPKRQIATKFRAAARQGLNATGQAQQTVSPKIALSFRPEVGDISESLDAVFATLFNTVSHYYREQHEHGVVGTTALEWLVGASSEALDCANREIHARGVTDFKCVDGTFELIDALVAEPGPMRRSLSGVPRPPATANTFAPILVEYLFVKDKCSSTSWFDLYPATWKCARRVRDFGHRAVLTKIECLYAFIECHERVQKEFVHLERFPALLHCYTQVLNAAREDLMLLQDANPRRFYYGQHVLLLKIVISGRMRKLEEDAEEGWLGMADAEPLVQLTHDLLAKVETHSPAIQEEEEPVAGARNPWRDMFAGMARQNSPSGNEPFGAEPHGSHAGGSHAPHDSAQSYTSSSSESPGGLAKAPEDPTEIRV